MIDHRIRGAPTGTDLTIHRVHEDAAYARGVPQPIDMDADAVIELLGLTPHPEGGYYGRTFADDSSSAIYYLLEGSVGWSTWHRLPDRSEIWHIYAGAPLELEMTTHEPDAEQRTVTLGSDLLSGNLPQAVVPAGWWQRVRSTGSWSLAGCTVSPPFTLSAFELLSGRTHPRDI